ncbi:hypothetical protein A1O1_02599 [Capronia coronata CBS 617.96]|uniref:BRCT domain-containing protein n=1 Tax=Capronia coronata CBS 617.96 TaxID=1182541 RepID=W9YY45_9EURO|nr:uncharacterized protein A1O1_02599 [Capronia coronata CBS 617.96]EXJ94206.1 hypothetical protein A1O1_02599 [Capronia coronata CBS 617.96]
MAQKKARGLRSAEQPLQGAVLCFTSVGPEERTRYADLAIQMGAQHKLDLTSDTTHLIVGNTDTLKYQYVAKEREDIAVLRPEWVEEVRECWINDLSLDLDALTREYRMPTLAGLKICITGFEDLSFRAQLQRNVVENGGEYTGDLTKDVTHLIAAKPEGKKYEYGMQWQKKVVSLKWYKDSLDRGMQLDETLYHPTIPVAEQGVGAWNRRVQRSPQLGKRAREDDSAPEPSRKLRRTASAKLGGQSQDLWTDIVAGAGFEAKPAERPQLKPSVSMPAIRRGGNITNDSNDRRPQTPKDGFMTEPSYGNAGFLSGRYFIVRASEEKKEALLQKILVENGATMVDLDNDREASLVTDILCIVPHDLAKNKSTAAKVLQLGYPVVSEFWLERCMLQKSFIPPQAYPLGLLFQGSCTTFATLTVNATGFDAYETLHISKMVTLLGGKYSEVFTAAVSVLVCKSGKTNTAKLDLAQHSGIPSVSEEWLWSTIKNGRKAQVESYLVRPGLDRASSPGRKQPVTKKYIEVSTVPIRSESRERPGRAASKADLDRARARDEAKNAGDGTNPEVEVHEEEADDVPQQEDGNPFGSYQAASPAEDSATQAGSYVQEDLPLQELSNSSGRSGRALHSKKTSIQSFDGNCSMPDSNNRKNSEDTARERLGAEDPAPATNIGAINGAIREILELQTKIKPKPGIGSGLGDGAARKGRLVGRALSNLSNSSVTSNLRISRASSVDSVNTDGIGSEVVKTRTENSTGEGITASEQGSFSFTGRAKRTLAGFQAHSVGMDDLDLSRCNHQGEEAPPMTQLGYEDPEEAILLRQQLAESRRKRSGAADGKDREPNPVAARPRTERKLRDDALVTSAGWGAGRRTRHKQRSPQRLKGF